jgi:hypothetical protein
MSGVTVYIFHFLDNGDVARIPYAQWKRINAGIESVEKFSNRAIRIAPAYLLLENKKPYYCPHIEGGIYYFDRSGGIIPGEAQYIDLLQELDEASSGVIDLEYRKKKKASFDKYCWQLNSRQIQAVIDSIW